VHRRAARLTVRLARDLGRSPAGKDGERRPQVRRSPAERLAGLVRALGDGAAHPRAGDVGEVRLAGLTLPGAEPRPPEVDLACPAVDGGADGVVEPMRDAVGAREVATGPAWKDRELDVRPPGDSVDDLVDRAVPADGDEQLR